jgi:anti-sigma B factor antagonist
MGPLDVFGIHETPLQGGGVRLMLVGELDLSTAPTLEQRLDQLRVEHTPVRLDLSRLEFVDSSGLRVLIAAWNHAQRNAWRFGIDPDLSSQVRQLFELVDAKHLLVGEQGTGR